MLLLNSNISVKKAKEESVQQRDVTKETLAKQEIFAINTRRECEATIMDYRYAMIDFIIM